MNDVINVLLIDDDKFNFDSLKNRAAKNRVVLHFKDNLQDGIIELRANAKLDAVILDGIAFLNPGQVRGSEKSNFVHQALTEIKMLEKEQERVIPHCVLTAWFDQLKDSLDGRTSVYDKKKVSLEETLMSELFNDLKRQVLEAGMLKIRRKYEEIFDVVQPKYFSSQVYENVAFIMALVERGKIQKSNFNTIREVLEAIFLRANSLDKYLIPDELLKIDGRPNLEWCYRYLSGQQIDIRDNVTIKKSYLAKTPIVPAHIGRSIDYVKQVTSIFSHTYNDSWSKYSFKSSALAIGEILIWFKQYVDKNYPHI